MNPLTMLMAKNNGKREFSQLRVAVFVSLVAFVYNWPESFGPWDFAALATILLALPISDLFAKAPVQEALTALTVIFAGAASKRLNREDLP